MVAISEYPQVRAEILWHCDYYDRPLDGVCEIDGKRYWYTYHDGEDAPIGGIYLARSLTPEQLQWAEYWHEEFRKYVGHHTDHRESRGKIHPQSEWPKFYDRYRLEEKRDYSELPIIGWFED
jgi:hypothetical protein